MHIMNTVPIRARSIYQLLLAYYRYIGIIFVNHYVTKVQKCLSRLKVIKGNGMFT